MRLYYKARCSKSRAALALLERAGHAPTRVDYLADPIDAATLGRLLEVLDSVPGDLVRCNDPAFERFADTSATLTRERVIEILLAEPSLMQRPVLEIDGRAVIARPPERVFELVDDCAASE